MRIRIVSVDHAPDDLERQLPIRGRLLREIAGPDRPDYWLAELRRPLSWAAPAPTRTIRHLVVRPRWQGTSIGPGANIPVNIYYVTDDRLLESQSFDRGQVEHVAIGMIEVSGAARLWKRFWR